VSIAFSLTLFTMRFLPVLAVKKGQRNFFQKLKFLIDNYYGA